MARSPEHVLVWGAGGHGKVVAELVEACGCRVAGFIDARTSRSAPDTPPIIDEEEFVRGLERGDLPARAGGVVLAIGRNAAREERMLQLGPVNVPAFIHPSATVSPSATLGDGSVVLPHAVINADAAVGRGVIINTASVVEHDCVIGDAAHVSPGAVLAGAVHMGARAWIGAGATVIERVRIGTDAVVGAGAVVIGDVADASTVVGVPARPIGRS